MRTARIFRSGNSQAVRLPKDFQFDVDEVEILRRGDEVVLRKKPETLEAAFQLLADLPNDFFCEGRQDAPPQEREDWA
jgi:antitoxin VapB